MLPLFKDGDIIAVTAKYYSLFFKSMANKEVDFDSDALKLALFTSALTVNQDTHQYFDAAPYTSNQVANGNGYVTGGQDVSSGASVTYDGATNKLSFDVGDASWTSATFTARYGILYDNTPTTNKPLVLYLDFGADQPLNNGTLSVSWDSAGIAYVQVA